jgi:hypothetical protein
MIGRGEGTERARTLKERVTLPCGFIDGHKEVPRMAPQHELLFPHRRLLIRRNTWSGASEIRRQFRLVVHAGGVELGEENSVSEKKWFWTKIISTRERSYPGGALHSTPKRLTNLLQITAFG